MSLHSTSTHQVWPGLLLTQRTALTNLRQMHTILRTLQVLMLNTLQKKAAAAMEHMKAMELTVTNTVFATTCLTTPTTTSTTRLTVKQAVSCGWKKMVTAPMMAITVMIQSLTRTPTILQRQIVRPLDTCGWNLATMMKK